jgi:hypothetical protein
MASYGRNFDFRVAPEAENRKGRFAVPAVGNKIPLGTPVGSTGAAETALGLAPVAAATGSTVPQKGKHGILVYEYGPAAFAGDDPFLTTYSDKDVAPLGAAVQVVSGREIKVVLRNTSARHFLGRAYNGRVMVAGLAGATPTVVVGSFLTPGTGDDVNGYWTTTNNSGGDAWLLVTHVDNARAELEAQLLF